MTGWEAKCGTKNMIVLLSFTGDKFHVSEAPVSKWNLVLR